MAFFGMALLGFGICCFGMGFLCASVWLRWRIKERIRTLVDISEQQAIHRRLYAGIEEVRYRAPKSMEKARLN